MQPQPTPLALDPTARASWPGSRLETFDGMRTAGRYWKLREWRDRYRDDGGRPATKRNAGQSRLIRRYRDWGGGGLQLLPEIERRPFAVSKAVSGKAGLKSAFPAGQPETIPIVKEDRELGRRDDQDHQQSDGEGELDQALTALTDGLHSWRSTVKSGVNTRKRMRTRRGPTKKIRAGTVIKTGARVIRSR